MSPLDTALHFYDLGIATIPIGYRDKRPSFTALKQTGDLYENGRPQWKTYQDHLPDKAKLKAWFSTKFINVAVVTGFKSMVVIDFDSQAIWQLWQSWIQIKNPVLLRQTYRVSTCRGQHVYLFVENPPERTLKITTNEKDPKQRKTLIDIKAAGGYCLCPPSIHPTGHKYRAINTPNDIMTVESLECVLPGMLLEKATENDVVIPEYEPQTCDVWSVTPNIQGLDSIQQIKQNRSILEFFPNAVPSGGNRWYKVLCPFHNDTSPSGWIDVQRNRFGCQTCMNHSLDVIDFYALLKNVDRSQAIRELST